MTLADLTQAVARGELLRSDEAVEVLKGTGATITGPEAVALYKGACAQAAHWNAKYLFSPRVAPDREAATQAAVWRELQDLLVKQFGDASLERPCEEFRFYTNMHWVVSYSQAARPGRVSNWWFGVLTHAGQAVRRVGLDVLGVWLYRVALYPSESVGRVEG
jgi:hypothetical protein